MTIDRDDCDDVTIGVSPHLRVDALCDEFAIEIDPICHADFLLQLASLPKNDWHMLENVFILAISSPHPCKRLLELAPRQTYIRLMDWIGRATEPKHPTHVLTIANTKSLYCNSLLINIPDAPD
jgi:hypothetical protein